MMDTKSEKEHLRKSLLIKRSQIPEFQWRRHSETIVNRLKQLPEFQGAVTIHCYVSMNDRKEVNTHKLIKYMLKGGKRVVVPVTDFERKGLTHFELDNYGVLKRNKWGIPEPQGKGTKVSEEDLDLVIIPMVGGDEHGNRIGYGGGFYDRFLQSTSCSMVGLTFEATMLPHLPVESFDVPLDKVVTEERVIENV